MSESVRFGIRNATQDYSGVVVLSDVDFDLTTGTVQGLVGENGSGKSTLIKILTGAVVPSAGQLYLGDRPVRFSTPAEAQRDGIGVVHQDYHLFPDLSVIDNVFGVGKAPPRRSWFPLIVDKPKIRSDVRETLGRLGIDLDPDALVRTLGPAERKFVEIARAMLLSPQFLILDEPTASLEPSASQSVLELLGRLRERGVGLLFVSHCLDEVLRKAPTHRAARRCWVGAAPRADSSTKERLTDMILGRKQYGRAQGAALADRRGHGAEPWRRAGCQRGAAGQHRDPPGRRSSGLRPAAGRPPPRSCAWSAAPSPSPATSTSSGSCGAGPHAVPGLAAGDRVHPPGPQGGRDRARPRARP